MLANAIKVNYRLKKLDLSNNNIGDKGIAIIVLPIAK